MSACVTLAVCRERWLTLRLAHSLQTFSPMCTGKCLLRQRSSLLLPFPLFPRVSSEAVHRCPVGSLLGDVTISFCSPTQECPCVLTVLLLQELGLASAALGSYPTLLGDEGKPLGPGDELLPGQMLQTDCGNW